MSSSSDDFPVTVKKLETSETVAVTESEIETDIGETANSPWPDCTIVQLSGSKRPVELAAELASDSEPTPNKRVRLAVHEQPRVRESQTLAGASESTAAAPTETTDSRDSNDPCGAGKGYVYGKMYYGTGFLANEEISTAYQELVVNVCTEMKKVGHTFENVRHSFEQLLRIELPLQLKDVTDFFDHLQKLKMCHDIDVDLLSELLCNMQPRVDHIQEQVIAYSNKLKDTDVTAVQLQWDGNICPSRSDQFYLLFTFHDFIKLTLGEVFEIKGYFAGLFQIRRHAFTFVSSLQHGSTIGLIWQMPKECLGRIRSSVMESDDVKSSLVESKYLFLSIEIQSTGIEKQQLIFSRHSYHKSSTQEKQPESGPSTLSTLSSSESSSMDLQIGKHKSFKLFSWICTCIYPVDKGTCIV